MLKASRLFPTLTLDHKRIIHQDYWRTLHDEYIQLEKGC